MEAQLEQLRVDIDHEDTQAQVRQIASSEFFLNLKSQAKLLREERRPALESAVKVSSNADE
jgi:hypothetical protein